MICKILFLQLGLKFPSDREDFLVKMCILLSLIILGPCVRGSKVGNKWINKSYETIWWDVPHPVPLVWLVIEWNKFSYVILGHSKIIEQCRMYLWGQSGICFLPRFPVDFWLSLVLWELPFLGFFNNLLYSSHSSCLLVGWYM